MLHATPQGNGFYFVLFSFAFVVYCYIYVCMYFAHLSTIPCFIPPSTSWKYFIAICVLQFMFCVSVFLVFLFVSVICGWMCYFKMGIYEHYYIYTNRTVFFCCVQLYIAHIYIYLYTYLFYTYFLVSCEYD